MTHRHSIRRAVQDHRGSRGQRKAALEVEELLFLYEMQVNQGGSVGYVARKAIHV